MRGAASCPAQHGFDRLACLAPLIVTYSMVAWHTNTSKVQQHLQMPCSGGALHRQCALTPITFTESGSPLQALPRIQSTTGLPAMTLVIERGSSCCNSGIS